MEVYSTQIDELPDDISEVNETKNYQTFESIDNQQENIEPSLMLDILVLFMISLGVSNKPFIKFLSDIPFIPKNSTIITIIMASLISILFLLYKLVIE